MKVKELIKQLEKCNQEDLVVMSIDGEGNSYNPIADVHAGMVYSPERQVGYSKLTPTLISAGFEEEDIINGEPCIILCPV